MDGMVKPSWTGKKINERLESFIAEARELEDRISENLTRLLE